MNDVIQALAEELAGLSSETDASRIRDIKSRIYKLELDYLKVIDGKADFPLLTKYNRSIPFEDFWNILTDVIGEIMNWYKPNMGSSFVGALKQRLNNRAASYFRNLYEKESVDGNEKDDNGKNIKRSRLTSLDEIIEVHGESAVPVSETDFTIIENEISPECIVFIRLATLISEQKKIDEHITKKMFFERFFTFDITKTVKDNDYYAEESYVVNGTLFPVMEIIMLEYIMYGTFFHMRDVVENELKDTQVLGTSDRRGKRGKQYEVICECYNVSKPTVVERHKQYEKLRVACFE